MNTTFLLLGTNIGNRVAALTTAMELLRQVLGNPVAVSSVYETAAWGKTDQQDFLNMAIAFQTDCEPEALLAVTQNIELKMGRERKEKWGPRIIDIDILFIGNVVFHSDRLTVPHPMLHQRRFTLLPLLEIAPGQIHPVFQKSVQTLAATCTDHSAVTIFSKAVL